MDAGQANGTAVITTGGQTGVVVDPAGGAAEGGRSGHVVVCGLDGLGLRTITELARLGIAVVAVAGAGEEGVPAERARALGAAVVAGDHRDIATLATADVARARALVLTDDDDDGNLHAAIAAAEQHPGLRLVVRLFRRGLGAHLETLLPEATVLSPASIAAPAFAAAALHGDWADRLDVAGRALVVGRGVAGDDGVLLPLARAEGTGEELFPTDGDDLLCLRDDGAADAAPSRAARARRLARRARLAATVVGALPDRRLGAALGALAALVGLAAAVFHRVAGLGLLDAVYFAVTIVTTTGFGDFSLRDATPPLKVFGIALMFGGAAAVAVLYALVVDAVVGARLARALGQVPRRLRGHTIVCGLGSVGYRIAERLERAGVPLACAELREDNRFLDPLRRLGVSVLVADASFETSLRALGAARARCLVAASDDDVANLATALAARALNPHIRVVLRLHDPAFAERAGRLLGADAALSVSALAAPLFAAAALGARVHAAVPLPGGTVLIAGTTVAPGSAAVGAAARTLGGDGLVRLVHRPGAPGAGWRPDQEAPLAAGERVVVAADRRGLARFLAATAADGTVA